VCHHAAVPTPSTTDPDPAAIFVRDGELLVPSVLSQGPWSPDAQHGGPVCAALISIIEAVPSLVPMQIARCTFDLYRAVPIAPLRTAHRVVREGKRLQVVEAELLHGDTPVARASAMRLRVLDTPEVLEHPLHPRERPPHRPGTGTRPHPGVADRIGFLRTFEIDRTVRPSDGVARSVSWYRLLVPIVAGEPASPLQRLALFADFTSSVASYLDHARWSSINPDLSLQVLRAPRGEWLCLDSTTEASATGMGHSHARVFDDDGFVGTVTTSQLIDPVRAPFA
jgi:hypothetical protein